MIMSLRASIPQNGILSAEFFMLFSRIVFIVESGGIRIVDILVQYCESFRKILMASLLVSMEEHVSTISRLMSLRTRIATPPPCLLGLSLQLMI